MSHIATYRVGLTGKVSPALLALAAQGVANLLGATCTVAQAMPPDKDTVAMENGRIVRTRTRSWAGNKPGDIILSGPFQAIIRITDEGPVVTGMDLGFRVRAALQRKGLPTDRTIADLLQERYVAMALATVAAQRGYKVSSQQSKAGGIALLAQK